MQVGVDTGGTFTDLVTDTGTVVKVLSTPDHPDQAVRETIERVTTSRPALLAHGTTVATNALLEGRGGRVALIATAGFADVIEIARQARPSLYDPHVDRPPPLVPRDRRLEVAGRLDGTGHELEPLDPATVPTTPTDVDAVAVALLHADLDPIHEQTVATVLRDRGVDVTCSHEVSPQFREYERTVTTVANALLRPACRGYLHRLGHLGDEVLVMTSAGGLMAVEDAAALPAALLLSGPAAGVQAAAAIAAACGYPDAVSFDMGGTSTDVCLVRGGAPEPAGTLDVAGYPIRLPAIDVHTIGAGGGSIATIDRGGALTVGPRSAGAVPGPACYGRGGTAPTVTDADLVLGRIDPSAAFPDLGALDVAAARAALDRAATPAAGVIGVVDAAMQEAVRAVSVARGVDPHQLALVAFGGAGPLHGCAVADALGMPAVIVPPRAGVLSALGLLWSPRRRELVRTWPTPDDRDGLHDALASLGADAARLVGSDAVVSTALDCRYAGQSHELTVAHIEDFHAEHARRNGYARHDVAVDVIALRARASRPAPLTPDALPAVARPTVHGPDVVAEPDCTVWVPAGWTATPGPLGAWLVRRDGEPR